MPGIDRVKLKAPRLPRIFGMLALAALASVASSPREARAGFLGRMVARSAARAAVRTLSKPAETTATAERDEEEQPSDSKDSAAPAPPPAVPSIPDASAPVPAQAGAAPAAALPPSVATAMQAASGAAPAAKPPAAPVAPITPPGPPSILSPYFDNTALGLAPTTLQSHAVASVVANVRANLEAMSTGGAPVPMASTAEAEPPATAKGADAPPGPTSVNVVKVLSGDTVRLNDGQRLRLVGCAGTDGNGLAIPEAKEYLQRVVEGQWVRLVYDAERLDASGCPQGFLYLADGTCVNAQQLSEGRCRYDRACRSKQAAQLMACEREAQQGKKGLWLAAGGQ